MFNDKIIRVAFLVSLSAHLLLLGTPGFNVNSPHPIKPEEITIQIEIEKPPLLPKIDVMGEEKKLKEVIEKAKPPEPEPEPQPKEVVMGLPPKEQVEQDIEVIDPTQEAMRSLSRYG